MKITDNELTQEKIKESINKGMKEGMLKAYARKLNIQLEDLYEYYILEKYAPTAEQIVEELKDES